ncbi:MAG: hypothetical protein Q9187_002101 [Circinaria calcarea]
MEDKYATHLPSSSPTSPYFLLPPSTADVVALELVPTSKHNSASSDNALLVQSLTEHLQAPKAKTLAQPGITEEFDAPDLHSPLSLHVRAHTQTPPISTTNSSRSIASTESNLSDAVDKEPALLSSNTALFSNTVSNSVESADLEGGSPPTDQGVSHRKQTVLLAKHQTLLLSSSLSCLLNHKS